MVSNHSRQRKINAKWCPRQRKRPFNGLPCSTMGKWARYANSCQLSLTWHRRPNNENTTSFSSCDNNVLGLFTLCFSLAADCCFIIVLRFRVQQPLASTWIVSLLQAGIFVSHKRTHAKKGNHTRSTTTRVDGLTAADTQTVWFRFWHFHWIGVIANASGRFCQWYSHINWYVYRFALVLVLRDVLRFPVWQIARPERMIIWQK